MPLPGLAQAYGSVAPSNPQDPEATVGMLPDIFKRVMELRTDKMRQREGQLQGEALDQAEQAYDQQVQAYDQKRGLHDQAMSQYDQAKSHYEKLLSDYSKAKSVYEGQVDSYNSQLGKYSSQTEAQAALQPYFKNTYSSQNPDGYYKFYDHRDQPYYAKAYKDWRGRLVPRAGGHKLGTDHYRAITGEPVSEIRPVTAVVPSSAPKFTQESPRFTTQVPVFNATAPEFSYDYDPKYDKAIEKARALARLYG